MFILTGSVPGKFQGQGREGKNMSKQEIGNMVLGIIGEADFDAAIEFGRAANDRVRELERMARIEKLEAERELVEAQEESAHRRQLVEDMAESIREASMFGKQHVVLDEEQPAKHSSTRLTQMKEAAHSVMVSASKRPAGKLAQVIPMKQGRK